MREILSSAGSDSNIDFNDEDIIIAGSTFENDLIIIRAANEIASLISVLKNSNITLERFGGAWSGKIPCPFSFHKAGSEKTGSFNYNFEQDRFHCFGCGTSGRAVEFLSYKEGIDKTIIAERIIKDAGGYIPKNLIIEESIDPKIDKLLYEFSIYINNIILKNKYDKAVLEVVDKVTEWVDIYLAKTVPKRKVVVEELTHRLCKAQELLEEYNI